MNSARKFRVGVHYWSHRNPHVRFDEPLTGQELRNAKYHESRLLGLVDRLSKMPFWMERLKETDRARMEDVEFISEILFVLLEGGPLEAKPQIVDNLYEKYADADIDWLVKEADFREITSFLESFSLDYDSHKIKGVSHLYGLWCFAWHCHEHRIPATQVVQKLNELFEELRNSGIHDDHVREYKKTMSARTKSKSQRDRRLDALLGYCGLPSRAIH